MLRFSNLIFLPLLDFLSLGEGLQRLDNGLVVEVVPSKNISALDL